MNPVILKSGIMWRCREIFLTILLPLLAFSASWCQKPADLPLLEDSIRRFHSYVRTAEPDSIRRVRAGQLFLLVQEAFSLPGSFTYPFDSLKTIRILESPDHEFRIVTWDITLSDGRYLYFGLIRWNGEKYPDRKVIPLSDRTDIIPGPDTAMLDANRWLGALYYRVIPGNSANGTTESLVFSVTWFREEL